MNTGLNYFLFISISFLLGLGAGYFFFHGEKQMKDETMVSQPIESYDRSLLSDINAGDCSELSASDQVSCIEGRIIQKAIELKDASYCNELTTTVSQEGCELQVNRLLSLESFSAGTLCDTIESTLCPDAVLFLSAEESGDAEQCLKMSNEEYKQFCLRIVASPDEGLELIVSNTTCQLGDVQCEENNRILEQALTLNDSSACLASSNEGFSAFCQKEVIVYQAFLAQNGASCSALTDVNENADCLNVVRIASVLAGATDDCSSENETFTLDCQRALSLGYYPRFSFLQSE